MILDKLTDGKQVYLQTDAQNVIISFKCLMRMGFAEQLVRTTNIKSNY